MGAGHHGGLYRDADTLLHRWPAEVKIVAAVAFTLVVVATPREQVWAFGGYAVLLAVVLGIGRVPPLWAARRALVELPFVVLAFALPFTGGAPTRQFLGLTVSVHGLLSGWNILAKGTLGVLTSIALAATTSVPALLAGLERLHLPPVIVQIASFMVRYLEVVRDQAARMQVARISRGHDPRLRWQVAVFARTVGALFIRSFERGERVYLAMVSRGYQGTMPRLSSTTATRAQWAGALLLPLAGGTLMVCAWMLT